MNSFSKEFEEEVFKGWSQSPIYLTKAERYIFTKYLNNQSKTLEAGTGGGRISFSLEEDLEFTNIVAFDLVAKLIEHCKSTGLKRKSKIEFSQADVSNLEVYKSEQFKNILYTGQVLCMVPEKVLDEAVTEAYKLGQNDSTFIFSFMDWDSRWYNSILSILINSSRLVKFQKIQKYYLPEVNDTNGINKNFFNKKGYSILWAKKNKVKKKLIDKGFKIEAFHSEKEFSKKGKVMFFVCKK
ncbi:hypothetical protein GCM10022291_05470 [Postechiella marina]|uniref:Methyltransferase domain-containing protein n=1 Tax=Postechiella marina TaxID=943941 RepID=A0ABP8C1E3_9FLAO